MDRDHEGWLLFFGLLLRKNGGPGGARHSSLNTNIKKDHLRGRGCLYILIILDMLTVYMGVVSI